VALPGPTPDRETLERAQRDFHSAEGGCLVCREVEGLSRGGRSSGSPGADRRILENEHFVVTTLHAPLDPCHLRIFPRRHASSFAGLDDHEMVALADVLRSVLAALDLATGRASYNLLVHGHGPDPSPALHWHVELRPRLGRTAGFEQMTGLWVCPSDPAADAATLSALVSELPKNP
jgi:UDPglucose--hexose-1-phosphate uridylyltransferase